MEAPASVHVNGAENPIYLGPVHAVLAKNLSSADEKNEDTTGGRQKQKNTPENSPTKQESATNTRAALRFQTPTSNYDEHQVSINTWYHTYR